MSHYYDRQGQPMTHEQFAMAIEADNRVVRTSLPNGRVVSTVWLGIDHSFGQAGPPVIFESMVFPPGSMSELDCRRYSTEELARQGHAELVQEWTEKEEP